MLHSNFLKNESVDPRELNRGRFDIFHNADRFDRVVALTHAQQRDMLALNLFSGNLMAIPNVVRDLHGNAEAPRDKAHGIMLARLTKGKRIDHAIRATAAASQSAPGVHLDVYGDGDMHAELTQQINANNADEHITLCGYASDAKDHFRKASFSLLTSKQEGQGLVLLESMSAGPYLMS